MTRSAGEKHAEKTGGHINGINDLTGGHGETGSIYLSSDTQAIMYDHYMR